MKNLLTFAAFLLFPLGAAAAGVAATDAASGVTATAAASGVTATAAASIVKTAVDGATNTISVQLQATAIQLMALLIMLQYIITNWKGLIQGAELSAIFGKTLGLIGWWSVVYYFMDNGVAFMRGTAAFFYEKAGVISGTTFSPGYVMEYGLSITSSLLNALDDSQGMLGSLNILPSIIVGFSCFVILLITGLIAFKIFMLLTETSIVIALAPFSFAFAALNALKDQGLTPLKYLISMAYRAVIYAAVLAVMGSLGTHITHVFSVIPTLPEGDIWKPIFAIILGYGLVGALAFKADSIATMLASGTSQMTTGDAGAVATAAAATGGAVGGAVMGALNPAGGAVKSMREFMSELKGGGSSPARNFETPQLRDGPQRPQPTPAPAPTSASGKAMASAADKATGGKMPTSAINAGVDALANGKDKSAAMAAMIDRGASPLQAKNAVNAMKPDNDARGASIGGSGGPNVASGASSRSLTDRLENANRHLSQDNAAVHISMNTNAD